MFVFDSLVQDLRYGGRTLLRHPGLTAVSVLALAQAGSLMGRLGLLRPGASNAELASAFFVSENYFAVLGVAAVRGRTFESMSAPELAASPPALISENYGSAGSPPIRRSWGGACASMASPSPSSASRPTTSSARAWPPRTSGCRSASRRW